MNNRVVIRSLVLPEGYIAAMDDGMISWRPSEGTRRNIRLQYPATTLLAVGGPSGKCESVWCGDTQGNIVHISIPMLDILDKYCLNSASIRAICAVSTTSDKVIVGTSSGDIWTLGKEVPGNKILLFSLEKAVTSIRCNESNIIIQSGWSRYVFDWTGNEIEHHDQNKIFNKKQTKRDNRRARLLKVQHEKGGIPEARLLDMPLIA
tara:strand:- start:841 stop:1458 length:618 start_codon:yes stop_codon:yes gene_type:complete